MLVADLEDKDLLIEGREGVQNMLILAAAICILYWVGRGNLEQNFSIFKPPQESLMFLKKSRHS